MPVTGAETFAISLLVPVNVPADTAKMQFQRKTHT